MRAPGTPSISTPGGVLVLVMTLLRLFLVRHVRKIESLAPLRQRGPRIPQAFIMFALLWVVCFLRQRCASGNRFPCGLALGSHVVRSIYCIGSDHAVLSRSGLCCLGSSPRLCRCFLCRLGYVLCSVHHPVQRVSAPFAEATSECAAICICDSLHQGNELTSFLALANFRALTLIT